MKNFLKIDETLPALELSSKAGTNFKCVLPTDIEMEIVSLMETSSLEIFMLKHRKHHKILILICNGF